MKHIPKFRVWTGQKMEYNILVGSLGVFYCPGFDDNDKSSLSPMSTVFEDLRPDHLMEYAGFSDSNGIDLYHGDIVSFVDGLYKSIDVITDKYKAVLDEEGVAVSLTFIGNVFEDPELLL